MINTEKDYESKETPITQNSIITKSKIFSYLILTIIFIVTSVLSVLFIYTNFSDKTVFLSYKLMSPIILFEIAILFILYFLLDGLRSLYVLKALQIPIDLKYLIKLAFINIFLSNITPYAAGGGFAQIYFLNKKHISIGDATAATTIKSILPVIFFFVTTPIILITNKNLLKVVPDSGNYLYIGLLIISYILATYGCYKLIKKPKLIKKFVYKILYILENKKFISNGKFKSLRKKIFSEIDVFIHSIKRFSKGNKKYIFLSIFFMVLYLLSLFMFSVILMSGLRSSTSPLDIILVQVVLTFITYFAPTPGATGVAEGGFTLIFSKFVQKKDIVSLTFWWRFFTMYLGMLIGLMLFLLEVAKSKKKIKSSNIP